MAKIRELEEPVSLEKIRDIEEISTEETFIERERHGNVLFTCPLFDALKEVLTQDNDAKRNGILYKQTGASITIYQGNPSNVWGLFEVTNANLPTKNYQYKIRVFSSILRKILMKNESSRQFIEKVI